MAKGIFIEGLTKPKECSRRCVFVDNENYDCTLIPYSYKFNDFGEQYMHCPIVEVDIERREQCSSERPTRQQDS